MERPGGGSKMNALFDWLVVVLALVALVIVLLLRNTEGEDESAIARSPFEADERPDPVPEPVATPEPVAVAPAPEPVAETVSAAPAKPDDLKKIEGIGPKIASVLNAAGISTFAQLAATSADRIREILAAEDPRLTRLADPTTWAEQAQLAAAGKWDDLAALQDALKGGRRA